MFTSMKHDCSSEILSQQLEQIVEFLILYSFFGSKTWNNVDESLKSLSKSSFNSN